MRSFDSHPCCLGDPAGPAGLPQPSGHRRELPHFEAKMYTCSPLFSRTTSIKKQTETPRAIYEIYATPGLTTLLNDFADEPPINSQAFYWVHSSCKTAWRIYVVCRGAYNMLQKQINAQPSPRETEMGQIDIDLQTWTVRCPFWIQRAKKARRNRAFRASRSKPGIK